MKDGAQVILPAEGELPEQRAVYLGDCTFELHPEDRLDGDADGLVEMDPEDPGIRVLPD